jgi:glycine dehydrogenase subunit 1
MPYIANTEEQQRQMLAEIGVKDIEALFADIPAELRCGDLDLPSGLTEQETVKKIKALAAHNTVNHTNFLGGGFYDHYIPAAVPALVMRSEFYTAYTPYQPEVSQGTLQAIYEYQSAICRLTDMEVSNASLYDGGTAVFEAILMAMRITGRNRIIIDDSLSPIYRKMAHSYTTNLGIELIETKSKDGLPCRETIKEQLNDQTAALFVQNPNFFGCIDDVSDLAEMAHKHGALLVVSSYPISLGLLKTPGAMGADIVIGEGQSLGMPLSFGGPYLGFIACRNKHMRKMPGRIAGRTVDDQGRQGFVLTLQAREQHIRREKATSNICTNQGLCALTSLVYMSLLGKTGLRELAEVCAAKAEYAVRRLTAVPGVSLRFPENDHFNEFVLDLPIPAEKVIRELFERNIAAGFPLRRYWPEMDNCLLVAVTEKRTKEDIDYLAHALEVIL